MRRSKYYKFRDKPEYIMLRHIASGTSSEDLERAIKFHREGLSLFGEIKNMLGYGPAYIMAFEEVLQERLRHH